MGTRFGGFLFTSVYELASVSVWPDLAGLSEALACPEWSGFLPHALYNEISEKCPNETSLSELGVAITLVRQGCSASVFRET